MNDVTPRAYCPDCGPATVPHWVERWSVRMDVAVSYGAQPLEWIRTQMRPLVARARPGRMMPLVARALVAAKIGTIAAVPDQKTNGRARAIWEEAARRGIVMREFRPFGASREIFFASHGGDTIVFDGVPRPRLAHETSLDWMDDKGVIIKKFRAAGIPVPRGASCKNLREARAAFRAVGGGGDGGAVIVKPALGSRSRHTYMNLTDEAAVEQAFLKAQQLSPRVVVEEELAGFVFRITLVNGKIAGIMRREPPHVIGDGTRRVSELIEQENQNPLRNGPTFHQLPSGTDAQAMLRAQNLTLDAVPKKGRMVALHEKVSRAFGASTTEMTDIHPDNRALFLKIAAVLDDPLIGIDFMIRDMAQSWHEQEKCGVIECNSLPFIDIHQHPLKGPARNVASDVWDMIFPTSSA